ncbi:hypothetical protein EC574_06800 [Helicobacter pylori]|uniref:Uncharacterized protein n=1 Tax=Helicobacter pylori TaxID=210 RepID=A0A438ZFH7_HELPX|nr:hypothetical protein EC574_06800 [Helicobacter pylori]
MVGKIDFFCFLDKPYSTLFNFLKVGFLTLFLLKIIFLREQRVSKITPLKTQDRLRRYHLTWYQAL